MKGLFLTLTLFLFLYSCNQQSKKVNAKLQISTAHLVAGQSGGTMLYITNKITNSQRALILNQNQITLELENGPWEFRVVGWSGGSGSLSGILSCAYADKNLTNSDQEIYLSLNQSNCDSNEFSPPEYRFSNQIKNFEVINCASVSTITSNSNNCDAIRGGGNSFRLRLAAHQNMNLNDMSGLGTNGVNGYLTSICFTSNVGNSITAPIRKIPFGGSSFHPVMLIESFSDSSCTQGKKDYFFPKGLLHQAYNSHPAKRFSPPSLSNDLPRIFLEHGGIFISGLPFSQTILGDTSSPQNFILYNFSNTSINLGTPSISPAGVFSIFNNYCAGPLSPGSSCPIEVQYAPSSAAQVSGLLSVPITGPSAETITFQLSGTNKSPALISASVSTLNFTGVLSNESPHPSQSITLTNTGETQATVTYTTTGANFTTTGTCLTIAPNGGTCNLTFTFNPSNGFTTSNSTGSLAISYSSAGAVSLSPSNLSISLTGSVISKGNGTTTGTVKNFYGAIGNWNDYVNDTTPYTNPSSIGCEASAHSICIHAGEVKISELPSEFNSISCSSLIAQDQLGVFDWECTGTAPKKFRIKNFKQGKGLRNLLDPTDWKNNSLMVYYDPAAPVLAYQTITSKWWSNTVTNIDGLSGYQYGNFTGLPSLSNVGSKSILNLTPDNTNGLVTFSLNGFQVVYTVENDINVPGLKIDHSRVALVTLGNAKISTNNNTSSNFNCNDTNGAILSGNTNSLICQGGAGKDFSWIEIKATGHSYNTNAGSTVLMFGSRMSRIHNSEIFNGRTGIKLISTPNNTNNLITHTVSRGNSLDGFLISNNSSNTYMTKVEGRSNTQHGLALSNSSNVKIENSIFSENTQNGINIQNGSGNTIIDTKATFNDNHGLYIVSATSSRVYKSIFSYNQMSGFKMKNISSSNYFHDSILANNCLDSTSSENGALELETSDYIKINNIVSTANKCYGTKLFSGSDYNTITHSTISNNYHGMLISGSNQNILHNIVSNGNFRKPSSGVDDGAGLKINDSSANNVIGHFVSTHNKFGFRFISGNNNLVATNSIIKVGSNNTDCDADTQISNDLHELSATGSCDNLSSPSSYTLTNAANTSTSFIGPVNSDSKNTHSSFSSGKINFNLISDFSNFSNLFRYWAGYTGGNSGVFTSGNGQACTSGDCGLWDWRLNLSDTTLRNFSNLPNNGANSCPSTVVGHSLTTTAYSFYSRAFEVLDQFGDNDGLCEPGEDCILAPNFGAYQGEGIPSSSTSFICHLGSGKYLKYYPTNGI